MSLRAWVAFYCLVAVLAALWGGVLLYWVLL